MKPKHVLFGVMTALLVVGLAACVTEKDNRANLERSAKVSRADAERIALGKVPGGNVREGEIESEKGRTIWSFDIGSPGSKDINEVQVDAMTGEVVSVEKETPQSEAKEKKH
jgi:uncharacterized membrane protein YkoI